MKIVILDTTFDLTVKGVYTLVRHAAILIIASHRSIAEINSAVDATFDKNLHKNESPFIETKVAMHTVIPLVTGRPA